LQTNGPVSIQSNVRATRYDAPESDIVVFEEREEF